MPRTNRKKSTKTKANPSARQVITWAAILIVLVSVGLITLGSIREHTQKIRTEKAQTTRLNAAANDLQKVYDQLVATTPNIREKSFEKSCTQSSAVQNNGTIMCGAYGHVVVDAIEADDFSEQSYEVLKNLIDGNIFKPVGNWSTQDYSFNSKMQSHNFAHKAGSECSLSRYIFQNALDYRERYGGNQALNGKIGRTTIACYGITNFFIPDYTQER